MNRLASTILALPFAVMATLASAATYEDGIRLKNQQQLASATAAFAEVAAREPNNALAREQLAIVLGWQSRFDEAVSVWQQAIVLAPTKADYRLGLARVLYWHGKRCSPSITP